MYAIIEDSGTQIKVSQGDVIRVARRDLPADATSITFDRVLFISPADADALAKARADGGTAVAAPADAASQAIIGAPLVEGAKVTADILAEERSNKVTVIKFKRRKNYRRKKGHRQDYLKVRITDIEGV